MLTFDPFFNFCLISPRILPGSTILLDNILKDNMNFHNLKYHPPTCHFDGSEGLTSFSFTMQKERKVKIKNQVLLP